MGPYRAGTLANVAELDETRTLVSEGGWGVRAEGLGVWGLGV